MIIILLIFQLRINNENVTLEAHNSLSSFAPLFLYYKKWMKFFLKWSSESIQFGRLLDKQETLLSINLDNYIYSPTRIKFGSEDNRFLSHDLQIFDWFNGKFNIHKMFKLLLMI